MIFFLFNRKAKVKSFDKKNWKSRYKITGKWTLLSKFIPNLHCDSFSYLGLVVSPVCQYFQDCCPTSLMLLISYWTISFSCNTIYAGLFSHSPLQQWPLPKPHPNSPTKTSPDSFFMNFLINSCTKFHSQLLHCCCLHSLPYYCSPCNSCAHNCESSIFLSPPCNACCKSDISFTLYRFSSPKEEIFLCFHDFCLSFKILKAKKSAGNLLSPRWENSIRIDTYGRHAWTFLPNKSSSQSSKMKFHQTSG